MTEKWILKDGVVVNTENNMTFDSFTELVIVLNGQSNDIKTLTLQEEDRKLYQRELENKIKELKSFKANVKEVLKHEYKGYENKVWGTWIKSLSLRLRVDIND